MKNLILHKEGEGGIVTWAKKRVLKLNLNLLATITGSSGIGKTYCGVEFAYEIDPEFDPEKQIVFSFLEVMKLANDPEFKKKKIKIILFDEPQTSISNREWQSKNNRLMNYLLSTFRHQNIIMLFCLPFAEFLDSASLKMMHLTLECKGVNMKKNLSHVRPKLLQYNPSMKKMYYHSLHVIKNKKVMKLQNWYVKKPPKHLIDVYEKKKTEFTNKLNREILSELEGLEVKAQPKPVEKAELTKKQLEVILLMKQHKNVEKVADLIGISTNSTYERLKCAQKKGHTPENYEITPKEV